MESYAIDEDLLDEFSVNLYRTTDVGNYDIFEEAQVNINISDFAYSENVGG